MKEIAPCIVVDKKVHFGKPVIKGTRVPVALAIGQLAGMTYEDVMKEYDLTKSGIFAVLSYAAQH